MNEINLGFNILAEIKEDKTKLFLKENNRNLPTKVINTADFVKIISSVQEDRPKEESPLLPGEYGTKKMVKKGSDYYFLITTPPKIRNLSYSYLRVDGITYIDDDYGNDYVGESDYAKEELLSYLESVDIYDEEPFSIEVYAPSMVWFIKIREDLSDNTYRLLSDRVYSKESVMLSMKDAIYPSPFSNVYHENNVCWGEVNLPELTIPGLAALERIFFTVDFNMDLELIRGSEFQLDEHRYKGKFLHLIKNGKILNSEGEVKAKEHMDNLIKSSSVDSPYTIEGEWNNFVK